MNYQEYIKQRRIKRWKVARNVAVLTTATACTGIYFGISYGVYANSNLGLIKNLTGIEDINQKRIIDYNNSNYKNALIEDAKQKAHNNRTSVYYIGWVSVFHKFGSLVHLLATLQENPNKHCVIYCRNGVISNLDENTTKELKTKYPNLEIEVADINSRWMLTNTLDSWVFDKFNDMFNFDFYCDDYLLLWNIKEMYNTYLNGDNLKIGQKIFQDLRFLYKASSINMFSDGTASESFFENWMYELNVKLGNVVSGNQFNESISFYNLFRKKIINREEFKINSWKEAFMFLLSPIVTNNKGNNYEKTKYFLPSTEMIVEMNATDSPALTLNDPNNWFDPFNSLSAGLIQCATLLKPENLKFLNIFLKAGNFNKDYFANQFKGYTNYIYSGINLSDNVPHEDKIKEANKIIYLYKNFVNKSKPFKVWFKGHPRDTSNIKEKLCQLIKEVDPTLTPEDWLFTLDNKIPFELYLANGLFQNTSSYKVELFGTYSTIALFQYDYNQCSTINKYLLTSNSESEIDRIYGPNSKVFEKSKRVIF